MPTIDGSSASNLYRTTAEAVRALGNFPSGITLDAYIETANALVDAVATCAGAKLTDKQLELLERWLAAHYAATVYPVVSSKSVLGASESYMRGSPGAGLESTPFGIQAMRLDTSGCLERLEKGTPSITWLGTES